MPAGVYQRNKEQKIRLTKMCLKNGFQKGNKVNLGKHLSEETKKKMRENHKGFLGKKHTRQTKEKMSQKRLGKKHTEETKKKMSRNNARGFLGKKHTKEAKKKIGLASKGNKNPAKRPEIREKIRRTLLGHKVSKKTRKRLSESHIGIQRGKKHPNWQGGKSFEPYPTDWTEDLKRSIRKRDSYVCQLCGIHQDELNYKLHCHHIDYDKDNLDPRNLISLCRGCHMKTNYNREYWIKYFNNK